MAKKKRRAAPGDIATNRQAAFRYNLLETFEAGIVLQGSEVKSLRDGGVQLKDAYADVKDGEVWLRNMHIAPYKPARENHDPERPRKLLLHRREIERLMGATSEKGLTIVPTRALLDRPAREGRAGRGEGQGPVRQAPLDQGPRHEARDPARDVGALLEVQAALGRPAGQLVAARQLQLAEHR